MQKNVEKICKCQIFTAAVLFLTMRKRSWRSSEEMKFSRRQVVSHQNHISAHIHVFLTKLPQRVQPQNVETEGAQKRSTVNELMSLCSFIITHHISINKPLITTQGCTQISSDCMLRLSSSNNWLISVISICFGVYVSVSCSSAVGFSVQLSVYSSALESGLSHGLSKAGLEMIKYSPFFSFY